MYCTKCAEGYMLTTSAQQCMLINKIDNCAYYTTESCYQCIPSYRLNRQIVPHMVDMYVPQYYPSLVTKIDQMFNFADAFCSFDYNNATPTSNQTMQPMVVNCLFFDKNNNCLLCKEGTILSKDGLTCSPILNNCKEASAYNICKTCNSGYILNTIVAPFHYVNCVAKVTIANCSTYGTYEYFDVATGALQLINGCKQCKTGYYTADGSTCTAVTANSKCSTFHRYLDQCVQCKSSYTVTVSGTCAAKINDCLLASAAGSTCLYCKTGYYFDSLEGECVENTIDKCLVQMSGSLCQYCESGYSLNSTTNICTKSSD